MARHSDKTTIGTVAAGDKIRILDIDDLTESAQGTGKVVTPDQLKTYSRAETKQSVTLGAAATTIAVTSRFIEVTGDAGANTIATITGGLVGQIYVFLFVDSLVTVTDDNSHASDTVDLSAAFTSANDTTLTLIYDGTSWYELSRSVN